MAHTLEPREELLWPDYWDGIDINDPKCFDIPHPSAIYTTRKEHRVALSAISSCLIDVVAGDYSEVETYDLHEFNPSQGRLPDGSVVVMDTERLERWAYPSWRQQKEWKRPTGPNTPAIWSPFAEYWRYNQAEQDPDVAAHFGEERAVFPELNTLYGRFLQWGVILSREDNSRFLETWGFAVPKVDELGVIIPRSYFDKLFHRAETLPLAIGQAAADPTLKTPTYSTDSITRLREVRIIYPDSFSFAPRKGKPSLREQLNEVADRLRNVGRISLPKPIPVKG